MAIIKVDGYELWAYTRVNPSEGMDLADQDFIDPQFTNSATGFGDELISVQMKNRELVVPVHLRATSKDSLHALVSDLNRRLSVAKQLEWRDDGATNSSYLKIQFARFEPEFNKRRQDAGWMSGTVRIYTEPYARTVASGYANVIGSFAGTGIIASRSIASFILGDGPTTTKFVINTPSVFNAQSDGRIVAGAVLPASYVSDWSAASLIPMNNTFLTGASGAVGSQILAHQSFGFSATTWFGTYAASTWITTNVARLILTNASAYAGNNRVLAVTAANFELDVSLVDPTGNSQTVRSVATESALYGMGLVDLGVININPEKTGATYTLTFSTSKHPFDYAPLTRNPTYAFELNRIILMPEDTSFFVVDDSRRKPLARIEGGPIPNTRINFDSYGQPISSAVICNSAVATSIAASYYPLETHEIAGWIDPPGGQGWQVAATAHDLTAHGKIYWGHTGGGAGTIGFEMGKLTAFGAYTVRYSYLTGSRSLFQIGYLASGGVPSVVACSAIAGILTNGTVSRFHGQEYSFKQQGPFISAELREYPINQYESNSRQGTSYVVATLSASVGEAAGAGVPYFGRSNGNFFCMDMKWSVVPSTGLRAGDVYTISHNERRATRSNGNVFDVGYGMRGDFLSFTPDPRYAAIVAYNFPLDRSNGLNQPWSASFELTEHFTYSK